jgi:L-aminopeptidase/D-esterase-like protein
LGAGRATKTGLGSAAVELGGGLVVAALIAVNPFGDVVDGTGRIVAGTRRLRGAGFADTLVLLRTITGKLALRVAGATVIGVVATNARLDKEGANKVAQMAQDGLARAIRPAHTLFDGDTLFALATGKVRASVTLVGAYAAEVTAQAIVRAARSAVGAGGLPAGHEVGPSC